MMWVGGAALVELRTRRWWRGVGGRATCVFWSYGSDENAYTDSRAWVAGVDHELPKGCGVRFVFRS